MHYILFEPNDIRFSGLENFKAILADNNIVLGFILAHALNTKFKWKNICQSVVFLPWAVSAFLIGMIFKWMFSEQNGLINYLLIKMGIVEKGISSGDF